MTRIRATLTLATLLALSMASPLARAADDFPTADVAGATDHPVISRFTGSLLVGYGQQDWAATELPGAGVYLRTTARSSPTRCRPRARSRGCST